MKKVLFIMLIVGLLVALAVPVFADKGGDPNANAGWGELHKLIAATGSVSELVAVVKAALPEDTNFGQYCKEVLKPLF